MTRAAVTLAAATLVAMRGAVKPVAVTLVVVTPVVAMQGAVKPVAVTLVAAKPAAG